MSGLGLYFHIPFCKAKCNYCDFYSTTDKYSRVADYITAVKKEMKRGDGSRVSSIFFGGGTPSSINASYICEILELCPKSSNTEITLEANPGTLTKDKLIAYKSCGINRISMGLQAWQDHLLKKLGRIHTRETFIKNFNLAREIGFSNINVDLIFGIPGQTIEDWCETLEGVTALQPTHISCYSLKIEEGTPFENLTPVDDELDRQMYHMAIETLKSHGFRHYEISNFAKEGFESVHNLSCWRCEEYLGFGAAAHSYFNGERYGNVSNIEDYINSISKGISPIESLQKIDKRESMSEFMILGLRLIDGISTSEFSKRFGEDIFKIFGKPIEKLISRGLLQCRGSKIMLTRKGLDFANQVFEEFI